MDNLSIDYINNRIKNEFCLDIMEKIDDYNLREEYYNCTSVKNKVKNIRNIFKNNDISDEKTEIVIKQLLTHIIPPGLKGVIRGHKFNQYIKNIILDNISKNDNLEIFFEKECEYSFEKPDWYIIDKLTNKCLVGMNQLDIFSGGQQLNRGSKYLLNNSDNKILCVICNKLEFKNTKSKTYKLFNHGFKNNTLCYPNNLINIIKNYFNVK